MSKCTCSIVKQIYSTQTKYGVVISKVTIAKNNKQLKSPVMETFVWKLFVTSSLCRHDVGWQNILLFKLKIIAYKYGWSLERNSVIEKQISIV